MGAPARRCDGHLLQRDSDRRGGSEGGRGAPHRVGAARHGLVRAAVRRPRNRFALRVHVGALRRSTTIAIHCWKAGLLHACSVGQVDLHRPIKELARARRRLDQQPARHAPHSGRGLSVNREAEVARLAGPDRWRRGNAGGHRCRRGARRCRGRRRRDRQRCRGRRRTRAGSSVAVGCEPARGRAVTRAPVVASERACANPMTTNAMTATVSKPMTTAPAARASPRPA